MLKVQPIRDKDIYHQIIYREIKALLDRILFDPILKIATSAKIDNNNSSELIAALKTGRITYAENYFTGKFNSKIGIEIRRLGGTFNKIRKAYFLPKEKIPTDIKIAAVQGSSIIKEKIAKINEILSDLQKTSAIQTINFNPQFSAVLFDIDKQYTATMPDNIGLPMTLSAFQRETIRREYTENLNKYIQDMTVESTERLREKVLEKVQEGYRASSLVSVIKAQQGVSDRHALFLAKQETSILVSTYRDSRYQEAGVKRYIWSTSHDSRVRHDHKVLDGKQFYFNQPPITNQTTGAKNNPGYDFGCRCVAIPILENDEEIKYGKK